MGEMILLDVEPSYQWRRNVPALDCYIVVTFYAPDGRWVVWREQWPTVKEAAHFVERLPRGHSNAMVFHLRGDERSNHGHT